MIRNLIFDWGGVLSFSNHNQAMERLREIGMQNPEQYFVEGKNWMSIFGDIESGSISPEDFLQQMSEICGRTITFEDVAYAWWGFFDGLMPGVLNALTEWHKKYRLYVFSNNNPFMMSRILADDFAPEGKPFRSYFDHVYASCDIHLAKPAPESYAFVLKDAGLMAEETVFVDDRKQNLEGAQKVGLHTFLADSRKGWIDALNKELDKY